MERKSRILSAAIYMIAICSLIFFGFLLWKTSTGWKEASAKDKITDQANQIRIYFHLPWPTHMAVGTQGQVFSYGQGLNRVQYKSVGSAGDGILYRVKEADYIRAFTNHGERVQIFAWQVSQSQALHLQQYWQNKIKNETPNGGFYVDTYRFLTNNCAHKAIASLPDGVYKSYLQHFSSGIPWVACFATFLFDKWHPEMKQLPTIVPEVRSE